MKAVLFDLDGTLLPMDMEEFTKGYFKLLAKKTAPIGYEPEKLIASIWKGTAAMVKNDGSCTNEEAFWKCFAQIYGEESLKDKVVFDEFYEKEFQEAKSTCGMSPEAKETVEAVKKMGARVILATNPIFPKTATESRIRWAGMSPADFEYYTTYENSCHSKPNLQYYEDILREINCKPEECIMVGNDVTEDMVAEKLGMKVFLLTDCLINKDGEDIEKYPHGGFSRLKAFLSASLLDK